MNCKKVRYKLDCIGTNIQCVVARINNEPYCLYMVIHLSTNTYENVEGCLKASYENTEKPTYHLMPHACLNAFVLNNNEHHYGNQAFW